MATLVFLAIKVIKMRREMRSKSNLMLAPNRVNPTLEDISSAKSQQVFVQ